MNIRKFTLTSIMSLIIIILLSMFSYQRYFSNKLDTHAEKLSEYSRIVKTENENIKIYKNNKWETLNIKGVELNSFKPGYGRFETGISKEEVLNWLDEIGKMNANVIKIPYIQPPSFYSAIYEYNLNRKNPIYIIHEVMLDEKAVLKNYDAFDDEILKNIKKDIKNTMNVINGQALIINNERSHRGIYLKDVSKYNLGYIVGTNINPELVTLTNEQYENKTEYNGEYFSIKDSSAFGVFITEVLDFAAQYERTKYERSSLLSFMTTVETDSLKYKHESNLTKYANVNIEKIIPKDEDNLFISYRYHPNSLDFLDYEYEKNGQSKETADVSSATIHLERLIEFYQSPLVISDTGISSSRAKSKINQSDGYDRGGFSEKEQGEKIVQLLDDIYSAGAAGAVVKSWQDDWTRLTNFSSVVDYSDENASSYWQDLQSSDESFGFLKFESGKKKDKIYIDGDYSEWENIKNISDEEGMKLKVKADLTNLYILVEKKEWSLNEDTLYLGLNTTPLSGSENWAEEAEFANKVDFIIKLQGYNESRVVVNERSNLFNYVYKYYSNEIEKETIVPDQDSDKFGAIYLLNRKKLYLLDSDRVISPIYYETGKLTYGNDNPVEPEFNSKADFNKQGDKAEIKIPWTLLNIVNPLDKKAFGDFYLDGVNTQTDIDQIGFSINYKGNKDDIVTKEVQYNMENLKSTDYFERLKASYYSVKDYWAKNPK